jgi:hypothetical protein
VNKAEPKKQVTFPSKIKTEYYWQCAYADAFASPEVIPYQLYVMLSSHKLEDGYARKYYNNKKDAINDLKNAYDTIRRTVDYYKDRI